MSPTYAVRERVVRILAIIHLCFAFTIIAWNCSYPFLGELFAYKASLLRYHEVMGFLPEQVHKQSDIQTQGIKAKMKRHASRFAVLPQKKQDEILQSYTQLQEQSNRSFFLKLQSTIQILLVEIPPFEQAWLAFAIAISILLLRGTFEVKQVVWILPLIALCYAVDNHLYGKPAEITTEAKLFPAENVLLEKYLKTPLNPPISEQRQQLLKGWQLYLIQEWAKEQPSDNPQVFQEQIERGEFSFNLARLEARLKERKMKKASLTTQNYWERKRTDKESLMMLFLYTLWNIFFAFVSSKQSKKSSEQKIDCYSDKIS